MSLKYYIDNRLLIASLALAANAADAAREASDEMPPGKPVYFQMLESNAAFTTFQSLSFPVGGTVRSGRVFTVRTDDVVAVSAGSGPEYTAALAAYRRAVSVGMLLDVGHA